MIKVLSGLDLSRSVLIGCEESGVVRRAFAKRGVDAWSCDLLRSRDGSNKHLQCDLRDLLGLPWGLLAVMHPPCTVLCNSGARWLYLGGRERNGRDETRWKELDQAAAFYRECKASAAARMCIENPVMHKHAIRLTGRGPTQFVQPWWFGSRALKATGLELINLPELVPTNKLAPPPPGTPERKAWSIVHQMPPGPNRSRDRSASDPNLAAAMADQWAGLL